MMLLLFLATGLFSTATILLVFTLRAVLQGWKGRLGTEAKRSTHVTSDSGSRRPWERLVNNRLTTPSSAILAAFCGYGLTRSVWGAAIGVASGCVSPALLAGQLRRRRLEAFQAQLPDTFVLVANSLKAGFSFLQALEMVAREAAAPSSDEFRKVVREINLGVSVEEALNSLTRRMPGEDLELAVAAILIQRQMGGNLSELLEVIATTIRDRIRIQGHLKSVTAQGRLTGVVVALLPVGLGAIMTILSPEFIRPLLTEPVGRVLLAGALGLELVGAWVIKRICIIDF